MASFAFRLFLFLPALLVLAGCNPPDVPGPLSGIGGAAAGGGATATATLAGSVQLAQAAPDAHAGILVFLAGTGFQARTDIDGTYRISNVPGGEYRVMAEKPGYRTLNIGPIALDPARHTEAAPASAPLAFLEKEGGDLDAATTSTAAAAFGSVVGEVYLQGAADYDGIRVQVENTPHVTITNRDGAYQLVNVAPGRYTVTFSHPGFRSFDTEVLVPAGGTVRIEDAALERVTASPTPAGTAPDALVATSTLTRNELSGARAIVGLVEIAGPDGAPVAEYGRVTVALDNSDVAVTPDAQGKFRIADLPPGVYKVTAALDGRPETMVSKIADVTTEETAQVAFRFGAEIAAEETTGTGTVTGLVVLGPPPPPPGQTATAAAEPGSGVSVGLSDTQSVILTAADGRFTFEDAPAGDRSLIFAKEGYNDLTVPVQIAGGAITDVGEVTLEPKLDRPRVVSTAPEQDARNVLVIEALPVVINFSKKMNRESVLRAVRVEPPALFNLFIGNGTHPLADDDTLVIMLSNLDERTPIRYSTPYKVTIFSSAMDQSGVAMGEEFTLRFTTGGVGVATTVPVDGQRGVVVDQFNYPVQIVFNGPIDLDTLNSDTIKIRPDHNIKYRVATQTNPVTGFTVARILTTYEFNTAYTVTVTRRVRTTKGQPLSNTPYTFRFTTNDPIPVIVPDGTD